VKQNRRRAGIAIAVIAVLALATAVRLYKLDRHAYQLDEMWSAEIAIGHGSVHQHLPVNRVIEPPWLDKVSEAPPAWRIWQRMDVTHPPLYSVILRLWEGVFDGNDMSGRELSVLLSVAAVWLLIDAVRLSMGWSVGLCAGLLAAVSGPLIDYGRETRNYAMSVLAVTAVAAVVVRLGTLGVTRRRLVALSLTTLAALLVHYFTVGVIAAFGIYILFAFRRADRRRLLTAIAIGIGLFALSWGPFMWKQRHLFATSDSSTGFLTDDVPHHFLQTAKRGLSTPVTLLFTPHDPSAWVAAGGGALFLILPWLLVRRLPWIGFWAAWMTGAIAVPAVLDLTRGTAHMHWVRYVLLAAPPVCVLWPAVLSTLGRRWVLAVAAPVCACLISLPDVYATTDAEPAEVAAFICPRWTADDLAVFAADPGDLSRAGAQYMMVDRYLRPIPCNVVFLTAPPTGDSAAAVARARRVWLFTDSTSTIGYFPQLTAIDGRRYPGRGLVLEMRH
jgi:hypothetical protein